MTAMVALLAAVNLGRTNRVAMADLRALAEGLGYEDVSTWIASGNLLLTTSAPAPEVERALEEALEAQLGLKTAVVVRTRAALEAVVTQNPFLGETDDPRHLHVVFTKGPTAAAVAELDAAAFAPEAFAARGHDLYLLLPDGVGRSPLAAVLRKLGTPRGTMRNWRTTTTLLEKLPAD